MNLYEEILGYCNDNVTLYGFANLKDYKNEIFSEKLKKYDYAVTIGIKLPDDIVENLDQGTGRWLYQDTFTKVNNILNLKSTDIMNIIKKHGYDAINVDSSYIIPGENFVGEISHKLVANLAGLGWIGKSALLITPQYGPRLRWATILTDATFPIENERIGSRCGTCRLCVDNCPAKAFDDIDFNEKLPRDERFDARACFNYFETLESQGKPPKCGICVKVCPWGVNNK